MTGKAITRLREITQDWTLDGSMICEGQRIICIMPADERGQRDGAAIIHAVNVLRAELSGSGQ